MTRNCAIVEVNELRAGLATCFALTGVQTSPYAACRFARSDQRYLEALDKMRFFNNRRRLTVVTFLNLLILVSSPLAFQNPATDFKVTDDMRAAIDRISAGSMREHLKFIASDELQGRNTPSPGLDRAADYIALQFKKAGLEAVGDDGYFQTANWVQLARNPKTFSLSIQSAGQKTSAEPGQVSFPF